MKNSNHMSRVPSIEKARIAIDPKFEDFCDHRRIPFHLEIPDDLQGTEEVDMPMPFDFLDGEPVPLEEERVPLFARINRGERARSADSTIAMMGDDDIVDQEEKMSPNFTLIKSPIERKRTFKEFSYRGLNLETIASMHTQECIELFGARARRTLKRADARAHARARKAFERTLVPSEPQTKHTAILKKISKAKKEAPPGEKPKAVRTHLRDLIIVPAMIGGILQVYNGKSSNQVEVKPEMIGHYLGEFSITYKPTKHGRPGIGATHSSRFIPLK